MMMRITVKFMTVAMAAFLLPSSVFAQAPQDEVVYYHLDAVGSVRATTNGNGQTVERFDYLPFGEPWPAAGTERLQFTGAERDPSTGLTYLMARYLFVGAGRFTSPDVSDFSDPSDPQSWSLYVYVINRPLTFVDPSGHQIYAQGGDTDFLKWLISIQDLTNGLLSRPLGIRPLGVWPVPGHCFLNAADPSVGQGGGAFGVRRSNGRTHEGIDINAPVGAGVVSLYAGTVVALKPNPSTSYGYQVVIKGGGVYAQYAHLQRPTVLDNSLWQGGETVNAGQHIGRVGRTGNVPAGAASHLHMEVRTNGPGPSANVSNPLAFTGPCR